MNPTPTTVHGAIGDACVRDFVVGEYQRVRQSTRFASYPDGDSVPAGGLGGGYVGFLKCGRRLGKQRLLGGVVYGVMSAVTLLVVPLVLVFAVVVAEWFVNLGHLPQAVYWNDLFDGIFHAY